MPARLTPALVDVRARLSSIAALIPDEARAVVFSWPRVCAPAQVWIAVIFASTARVNDVLAVESVVAVRARALVRV